ncbi:putative DNA polymerase III beta subunit [Sphingomonas phage vB_StuS_MMDA13]|jgi:DNA polymerase III sliding clamp (beta) subunit (PCNA family)|uniref:Putative DNA polymerase III beta subunit n=1 Tax=Sphingomonas phage vB_StuS_MMDA13 TaxID=2686378 RepID=A0A7G3PM27_9CAUD|nr:putative DNA polymerase III beta subunit [Sphingomonas phage vB_StuS_MMDA13]QHB80461.1 putative DNA polymerase III beta subunit [Sphingomonas phage vB_StuS_MMDA13]
MLKELKFVMGAVGKKDLLPAMTHFQIQNGHVRSYNGTLAISSPLPFNIDCCPKADQLVKAITQCDDVITLSMTPGGKLRVQSGKFRAFVENTQDTGFHPVPEGEPLHFDGPALFEAIKVLYPFIGNDASRPWTNGILLNGQSAFATNNTCIVEYWLGAPFPRQINIPRAAIKEMLRVDEPPTHAQLAGNSITFHYEDGRWIRTQLLGVEWPFEMIQKILNRDNKPVAVPPDLFDAINKLNRLSDGSNRIYINYGLLTTHTEEEQGGSYEVDGLEFQGCYNIAMLSLLEGVVTHADFTLYPDPALFFGQRLRGAIVGMRSHFEGQAFSVNG